MDPLRSGDPARVGVYRLVGWLGEGASGQLYLVYLGVSPGGHQVTVNLMSPHLTGDQGFRRRFAREVEAAKRVDSDRVMPVLAADPDGDPPWLATAHVPGPTLRETVRRRGPMSVPTVRALGAALAEGLAAIHACGLVHGAVRPGNVILAANGPRLAGLGIAPALIPPDPGAAVLPVVGVAGSTPAFLPPELVLGRARAVGAAGDVFSLGCVLAFAATGDSPFEAGDPVSTLYRIVREDPDLTALPDGLGDTITACLAKNPADRPRPAELFPARP